MKNIILLLITLFLCSCAMANIESTTADNQPCKASYISIFHSVDDINMSACGGSGSATGAQSDALSQALLSTMIKGLEVTK